MAGKIATWVPDDCLGSGAATAAVVRVLEGWSAKWFTEDPWRAVGAWETAQISAAGRWPPFRTSPLGYAIHADSEAVLSLALHALGTSLQASYTDADLRILRRLASRILEDLESRLSGLPGSSATEAHLAASRYFLRIGTSERHVLALAFPKGWLADLARAELPRSEISAPLAPASSAYAEEQVEVCAMIGRASVRVGEIRQLEVGDVMMLDRPGDALLPLAVAGRETTVQGLLADVDGKVVFEVASTQ